MCWQCLKKLMDERRNRKRSRNFAEESKKSPQSDEATESKTSET